MKQAKFDDANILNQECWQHCKSSEEKMASTPIKSTVRTVKPLLSLNNKECRRKVISLYKAWYRYIPIARK